MYLYINNSGFLVNFVVSRLLHISRYTICKSQNSNNGYFFSYAEQ